MLEDLSDEFKDADLKDKRRNERLMTAAQTLGNAPDASISAASGGWAELNAIYRLFNSKAVKPEALLAPHRKKTIARCAQFPCISVSQDTTELDFTHLKSTTGLGPLNSLTRRGFHLHSLYVGSEQGLPLGLLSSEVMMRDDETFGNASKCKTLPIEEKESYRWLQGYRETQKLAEALPDCEVFSTSDREGDIHEVFNAWQDITQGPRAEWIIRAKENRVLNRVIEGEPDKLFTALASAPILGGIEFEINARQSTKKVKGSTIKTSRKARRVSQIIRAMKVTPRPPRRPGIKLKEVSFWAILAEEPKPPEGEEPVRWLLLTSKKVTTLKEAQRIINLYLRRWDIEVFHKVLKNGCNIEKMQLKTADGLINALMIYTVIAWRILYFTHLGRQCPELPCGSIFGEAEWKSACAVVKRDKAASEPSLSEFIGIIGKLGGHLGRKSDGPPGPQQVWQGLARVRDFAMAWKAYEDD